MAKEQTNHSGRKHALLSASGAPRWLNCTPSARLEEKFEESTESVYAKEGTLAHEFGDITLRFRAGQLDEKTFKAESRKLKKDPLFYPGMLDEVDKYVNIIMEAYQVAKSKTPGAILLVEERFDFSHLVEQGFGTGDATIIADGVLDTYDLKFGKGVRVDADDNPQLKLYGSGALQKYELSYDIHTVRLNIIQPRLDHFSSWSISVEDLMKWGANTVVPTAAKAYLGEGHQKAGDWCKWCKVKGMCATLAGKNIKLARHEFKDPHLLTDDQISDVFKQIPMLVDWANAVGAHMLKEALNGKTWKGFKVVEGRANRKWKDEQEVQDYLELSFDKEKYMVSKLAGIPAIEKLVGKTNFYKELGEQIVSPPGKPALVPNSDKRRAMIGIEQAKSDFSK